MSCYNLIVSQKIIIYNYKTSPKTQKYQNYKEYNQIYFINKNTKIGNLKYLMTMSACYKQSELLQPHGFSKNEKNKTETFQNIQKL